MGNLGRCGRPYHRGGHCLPQERRQEHANGRRLGPSGREFGRRHAGGHGRGARRSASWLADRGKGVTRPPARSSGGQDFGGFEGGRSHPRQSANVLHRVCWLAHNNSGPSQPGERPRNAPARRPRRRSPDRRGQAPPPPGRGPHGRRGGKRPPHPRRRRRRSLLLGRRFSPYLYPSGTRDRRSGAIPAPVGTPKLLERARKRPLSRSRGQIRSRSLLPGPRGSPPNHP